MSMTEQELRAYIEAIRPADEAAMDAARRRQAQLANGCSGLLLYGRRRTGKSSCLRGLEGAR